MSLLPGVPVVRTFAGSAEVVFALELWYHGLGASGLLKHRTLGSHSTYVYKLCDPGRLFAFSEPRVSQVG